MTPASGRSSTARSTSPWNTMGGSTRWTWMNTSPMTGLRRWRGAWECRREVQRARVARSEDPKCRPLSKASSSETRLRCSLRCAFPEADYHDHRAIRPARPRRRRVSHRPEMAPGPPAARRDQVRDLQRRRGRPGGVHGPHDPRILSLPGHRRAGHRRRRSRRARGHFLHPPRVSPGLAAGEGGPGRVRAARLAGRAPAGERLPVAHLHQGRRRRVRLRRRDRPDRLGGRPPRDAALAPAVPRPVRPLGQAHPHQQRRDAGDGAVDHPPRRGGLRRHRHRDEQRHQGVRAGRQGPPGRA